MGDLLGLGKGADKLISTIERAIGAIYLPYGMRREADAEAYRIEVVETAKTKARALETVELARAQAEATLIFSEAQNDLEGRLQARLRYQALQQQQNIEQIVARAIDQVQPESTTDEVDADWLRGFFEHAQSISGEQMQLLWSRVLALEVGTPGTFSARSLDVLRKMTRREAIAFQSACRLASAFPSEGNRTHINYGAVCNAWYWYGFGPTVDLGKHGFNFLDRVNLAQVGLIYEDDLASGEIERNQELRLHFASAQLRLQAKRRHVKLLNYSLTPIGGELAALLPPEEDSSYIADLSTKLSKYFHVLDGNG
jgi:uncharacterized repeat protein (TIGR03899 family)